MHNYNYPSPSSPSIPPAYNYNYPQQQYQINSYNNNYNNNYSPPVQSSPCISKNQGKKLLIEHCPPPIIPQQIYNLNQYNSLIYQTDSFNNISQQIQNERRIFIDNLFPSSHKTHYTLPPNCSSNTGATKLVWKRIIEIYPNAKFIPSYGVKSSDVIQGVLGNCWFIGALATFTSAPELIEKIMPKPWPDNLKQIQPYYYEHSIFCFRFWKWGKWIEVIIDDRLPFLADNYGNLIQPPQLAFARCESLEYFWVSLLEKAYAKLHGSYAALDAGTASDAMVDFTGGIAELIDLRPINKIHNMITKDEKLNELWNSLRLAAKCNFFINCTNKCSNQMGPSSMTDHTQLSIGGLLLTHVYSVCGVYSIQPKMNKFQQIFSKKRYKLLVLRNPWGQQSWKGAWSQGSQEWQSIDNIQRDELSSLLKDKGQFLISLDDFVLNFTHISICRNINRIVNSMYPIIKEFHFYGSWTLPNKAGGCIDNNSWYNNPQYQLTLKNNTCVQISLQQKESRLFGYKNQCDFTCELSIGFHIFKVEENRHSRLHRKIGELKGNKSFINAQQVTQIHDLQQGNYIIIPTTYSPGLYGEYLLRIISYSDGICKEIIEEIPHELLKCNMQIHITTIWIKEISLIKPKGIHFDNKFSLECSIANKSFSIQKHVTSLNENINEGYIFYIINPNQVSLTFNIYRISRIKNEKHYGNTIIPLLKILKQPMNSIIRTNIFKPNTNEIKGTIDYSINIHYDPRTM